MPGSKHYIDLGPMSLPFFNQNEQIETILEPPSQKDVDRLNFILDSNDNGRKNNHQFEEYKISAHEHSLPNLKLMNDAEKIEMISTYLSDFSYFVMQNKNNVTSEHGKLRINEYGFNEINIYAKNEKNIFNFEMIINAESELLWFKNNIEKLKNKLIIKINLPFKISMFFSNRKNKSVISIEFPDAKNN